jgi:putative transposase
MILEKGFIYHIYNQGNNRQKIFFTRANYLFFLKKISEHILPYADILSWCLMPNHFHLIVALSDGVTSSHPVTNGQNHPDTALNNAIAVMLRSYTRAINIQENRSGALFREGTKAVWLGSIKGEKLKHQNRCITEHRSSIIQAEEHLQTCFRYIHENPVEAKLVEQANDWEFSSAMEFSGICEKSLVNRKLIEELGLI